MRVGSPSPTTARDADTRRAALYARAYPQRTTVGHRDRERMSFDVVTSRDEGGLESTKQAASEDVGRIASHARPTSPSEGGRSGSRRRSTSPPATIVSCDTTMYDIIENVRPGLTVAFVALPLSISLAVASQATPGMGTTTSIYGGLFGALVGGSDFNIQGPTGALSPILAWYSVSYGQGILPWLAIGAGILSLISYALKIDSFCAHMTIVVMEGFNLGVAFTNICNILPYGLGIDGLYKHRHLHNNIAEVARNLLRAEPFQSAVTISGAITILYANKWRPKFPWFMCIAILGMIFGFAVEHSSALDGVIRSYSAPPDENAYPLLLMNDRYPPLRDSLWSPPKMEDLEQVDFLVIANGSLSVMLLAVFETLISAKLADKRTGTSCDTNMEVLSVGFANIFCGMAGGFPGTAALARTTLNIRKGATSRTSAIISAVAVYAIVKFASDFFMYLPLPIVAAMMFTVNIGMPDWKLLRELSISSRTDFSLVLLVAVMCVFVDPGIGLLTGLFVEFLRDHKDNPLSLHVKDVSYDPEHDGLE